MFCCCHEVVFVLAQSGHYVIWRKLLSPPAPQRRAAWTLNMLERFLRFDPEPKVETRMICVLTYRHRVCFVITRLPYNKRGVLQAETDKHLDKLNKAPTRSFWDCIFIFGSSNLYVQASWFVCLVFFARDLWNW